MKNYLKIMLSLTAFTPFLKGNSSTTVKEISRCGDWTPFKDEKCIKIVNTRYQNQKESEIVCEAMSKDLHCESFPRLITIRSKDEQEFLQHFLFVENAVVSNVWLGLKQSNDSEHFYWNDGSEVIFSNWLDQNLTYGNRQCVELESGLGVHSAGLWSKVDCKKVNVVVCERTQTWSLKTLQNAFLNYKMTQELQKRDWTRDITLLAEAIQETSRLKQENKLFKIKLENLEENLVPIGFIYVQLPNQPPPPTLWPASNWKEISSEFEGLFFRVVGGNAAPFGKVQEGNTIRLEQVKNIVATNPKSNTVSIPPDGSWSETVFSGENAGRSYVRLQFRLSKEEIRPRNQAVRVWQRIQ